MASIGGFRISGLAGRRKQVACDLNPDINVFWGLNGTGKTSLLKILHSALTADATNLVRVPFTSAEVRVLANTDGGTVRKLSKKKASDPHEREQALFLLANGEILPMIDDLSDAQLSLLRRATGLEWESSPSGAPLRPLAHRYLPISRVSESRRRGSQKPVAELLDEATFDQIFAQQIQEIWRDYSTQALVQIRSVQERGLAEVLSVVLGQQDTVDVSIDMSAEQAYTLVQQFFDMQRLRPKLPSSRAFGGRYRESALVRRIVAEISDVQKDVDVAQEPQRKIAELVDSLFAGGKHVTLGARDVSVSVGKTEIPLESLSSGEKQMLRILVECVAARRSCILIDEPELSMHVDWQHRLVECMRTVNPHAQIILATHSPEVMANLADSAIFEL